METIGRAAAKKQGLKHYFTGVPCPRGHISKRFVSIGSCAECSRERAMEIHVHTTDRRRAYNSLDSFIAAATEKHKGLYCYDNVIYTNAHARVSITCSKHGDFKQNPTNHIQGKGCPKCKSELVAKICSSTKEEFIESAVKVWGDLYDYSEVDYVRAHKKVTIVCKKHGPFTQSPTNHLFGRDGCSRCNHMKSKGEIQVLNFLSFLTRTEHRNRKLLKPRELDIVLPDHNVAVEYCGEYHHGHQNAADEKANKNKHINKYKDCEALGVRLITIYESEWQNRNRQVKRLLRTAVGKLRGRVYARKCELRKVDIREAKAFFEKYHVQGGTGAGEHYGLYWKDKLVACMRFTFGGNDRGHGAKNRVWTLSRYATRVSVTGGASKLFTAFIRDHNPEQVKSFSDNRYFSGAMYEKLGFSMEQEMGPDYQVWSNKLGLLPKSHFQRRVLPKRLEEHGVDDVFDHTVDPRTEAEMTYLMGCRRLYDCGKKRWMWSKSA